MRTIIHDLNEDEIKNIKFNSNDKIVSSLNCSKSCIGCFSCWTKHPKKCAIKDEYSNMVDSIKRSDELILISKCRYGCYNYQVKRVLERCIGYVLPYFGIREGRIHHKSRFNDKIKFNVYFYGQVDNLDVKCAQELVKANSINLNAESYNVKFYKDKEELIKCIL